MEQAKHNPIYKELYLFEHERMRNYDNLIQFPTTILVIFIGASLYCFNNFWPNGITLTSKLEWAFLITFGAFTLSVLITIYYLSIVFHGISRKYEFLPYAEELKSHELSLYKYFYKYGSEQGTGLPRKEAILKTCAKFEKDIQKYYIDLTTYNQKVNDNRANAYYQTRTFLFFDLALLIIFGIITLLIK